MYLYKKHYIGNQYKKSKDKLRIINKGKLNDWREKLRKHIIVIANNPKDYDTYNKGWCAGQMDLLNSILKDEE